ncbi:MAG: amino acid permease [Odoribacter splanchnicus]
MKKNISTWQLALMTAAAVISLRGLPMMAQEELTMFFYIFFATFLFLIPAALVAAELGSAFADRGGGVYTWVKKPLTGKWDLRRFLQWIQNVVWYPTVLIRSCLYRIYDRKTRLVAEWLVCRVVFYCYVLAGYLVDL